MEKTPTELRVEQRHRDAAAPLMGALAGLIVAVQWEVSAIRDGVDVEKRLGILEKGATQALAVLVRNGGGL